MTVDNFIAKLKNIESYDMFNFWDKYFDSSCPCFEGVKTVDNRKVYVKGRCWRVSSNDQDLYIWGDLPKENLEAIAKEIKRALDETEWYNPYTVIFKDFNHE